MIWLPLVVLLLAPQPASSFVAPLTLQRGTSTIVKSRLDDKKELEDIRKERLIIDSERSKLKADTLHLKEEKDVLDALQRVRFEEERKNKELLDTRKTVVEVTASGNFIADSLAEADAERDSINSDVANKSLDEVEITEADLMTMDADAFQDDVIDWIEDYLRSDEKLAQEDIDRLRDCVFTGDLMADNCETEKATQALWKDFEPVKFISRDMQVVDGVAAIQLLGRKQLSSIYAEAQRRIDAAGLADKVLLFIRIEEALSEPEVWETVKDAFNKSQRQLDPVKEISTAYEYVKDHEHIQLIAVSAKAYPQKSTLINSTLVSIGLALLSFWTLSQLMYDAYPMDVSLPDTLMLPLLLVVIQIVHDLGHITVANMLRIPCDRDIRVLPNPVLGVMGTSFALKGYAKTPGGLFDFYAIGPIAGAALSGAFLFAGLQETAAASTEALAHFPHISASVLQSSFLIGGITNSLLPGLSLTAGDIGASEISLHPMAVAGALGLFSNALQCLPLSFTDGQMTLTLAAKVDWTWDHKWALCMHLSVAMLQCGALFTAFSQLFDLVTKFSEYKVGLVGAFFLASFFLFEPVPAIEDHIPVGNTRRVVAVLLQVFWLVVLLIPLPLNNYTAQ